MDDIARRIEKLEAVYPSQVHVCAETFRVINDRLSTGNVRFGKFETELEYIKGDVNELKECTRGVQKELALINKNYHNSWSKILTGISVTCILLVVNILIGWLSGG